MMGKASRGSDTRSHHNCPSAGRAGGWPVVMRSKVALENKNMTEEEAEEEDGLTASERREQAEEVPRLATVVRKCFGV